MIVGRCVGVREFGVARELGVEREFVVFLVFGVVPTSVVAREFITLGIVRLMPDVDGCGSVGSFASFG